MGPIAPFMRRKKRQKFYKHVPQRQQFLNWRKKLSAFLPSPKNWQDFFHLISLFLRPIFEFKKIRQFFGIILSIITLIAGIVSSPSLILANTQPEITHFTPLAIKIKTERSTQWPVGSLKITQNYHLFHKAIDIGEKVGAPVYPIMGGEVDEIAYQRGYGNYLIINHGGEFKSLYAHFSKILVKPGQKVDKNTIIGLVGTTGWTTGPHLHLETWDNNQPFNPLTILK